jgi:lysozyme
VGVWTVGYGTTRYRGKPVEKGDSLTPELAESLLKDYLDKVDFNMELPQHQLDALGSFVYNLGMGALKSSTLYRKLLKDPTDPTIPAEFLRWNKANGKVLDGLTKRRRSESELYATGELNLY